MPLESPISLCLHTSEHSWTCSIRAGRATPCRPLWSTPSLLRSIRSTFRLPHGCTATCLALAMRGFSNLSSRALTDSDVSLVMDSDVSMSRDACVFIGSQQNALPRIVTCESLTWALTRRTAAVSVALPSLLVTTSRLLALQPPRDRTNAPDTVSLALRASSQMMHTETDTTPFFGIYKGEDGWYAQGTSLGPFTTSIEAAIYHDVAAARRLGPTAALNYPEEVHAQSRRPASRVSAPAQVSCASEAHYSRSPRAPYDCSRETLRLPQT